MSLALWYHEDQRIRNEARAEMARRFEHHVHTNLVSERKAIERRATELAVKPIDGD